MHHSEAKEQLHAAELPQLFSITAFLQAGIPPGEMHCFSFLHTFQNIGGMLSLDAMAQYSTLPYPHQEWNVSKKACNQTSEV